MRTSRLVAVAISLLAYAGATFSGETNEGKSMTIQKGSEVGIEYTLTLNDGTVADSNVGGEPLVYTQGSGQLLPALEDALEGLTAGDTKQIELEAAEGYGEVNPQAYQNVPIDQIPEQSREVGAVLVASSPDGRQQQIRVHEVQDEAVVVDFNHPLAGKDLNFDIKVVSVE